MGNTTGTSAEEASVAGQTIFDFTVKDASENDVTLESFRGNKAFLIVNVASQWGLTNKNYHELQQLHSTYGDQGLKILGFPCNQFGSQEPGSNQEIQEFAQSKGATFPIFAKIDVNGSNAHPLYSFLKASKGEMMGKDIKWNFAKFLVNEQGIPVGRFVPTTGPLSIEPNVRKLLGLMKKA